MSTKDRLAAELEKRGAPAPMVAKARAGAYDDYLSESRTPIGDLVRDCIARGLHDMASRAMRGEFDGTSEEADEWWKKEGRTWWKFFTGR